MENRDVRVDAYIAKAAPFAQPVLNFLRSLVHEVNPSITETIKWGMPFFELNGPLCNMAAFKAHCAFGFWKAPLLHAEGKLTTHQDEAMGQLGKITSVKDLPPTAELKAMIRAAAKINQAGTKPAPKVKPSTGVVTPTPEDFLQALKKNKRAFIVFDKFPPSHRKEYNSWILEAKTDTTRQKRIGQAVEMIAEGKGKNWKYESKS